MARALALLFAIPLFALALPQDRELPLQVTADQAEFDELAGVAVYQGQVVLTQGSLKITGQRLTAYLENGEVQRLIAVGSPAYFEDVPSVEQGTITGEAAQIEWRLSSEDMQLTGGAELTQATNRFAGESVNYRQSDGVIQAAGSSSERVQMTLTPGTTQK